MMIVWVVVLTNDREEEKPVSTVPKEYSSIYPTTEAEKENYGTWQSMLTWSRDAILYEQNTGEKPVLPWPETTSTEGAGCKCMVYTHIDNDFYHNVFRSILY